MIRALKVTMIVYAVIGIVFGLAYLFFPRQMGAVFGYEIDIASTATLIVPLGICYVLLSIFLIFAARDPLQHILWVKCAMVFALLMLAAQLYFVIMGYYHLSEAVTGISIHAVIAAALLAFYPWRAVKSNQ